MDRKIIMLKRNGKIKIPGKSQCVAESLITYYWPTLAIQKCCIIKCIVENSWELKFLSKCKSWKMQQCLVVIFCTSDDLQQNPPKEEENKSRHAPEITKGVYCAAYSTHAAVVFWRCGCNSTFHLHAGPMTNRAIKLFERAEWRFYVCKHEDRGGGTRRTKRYTAWKMHLRSLLQRALAGSSVTNLLLARTHNIRAAAVEDAASGALASHNFYYLRT
jgi:hypothetical protein